MSFTLSIIVPLDDSRQLTPMLIDHLKDLLTSYACEVIFSTFGKEAITCDHPELNPFRDRIHTIFTQDANEGESDAIACGVYKAVNEWVTVLRYDEVLQKDTFEKITEILTQTPGHMGIFTTWYAWDYQLQRVFDQPVYQMPEYTFTSQGDIILMLSFILDKAIFPRNGIFKTQIAKQYALANATIESNFFMLYGLLQQGVVSFLNSDFALVKQANVDHALARALVPQRYSTKPYYFTTADSILGGYFWFFTKAMNQIGGWRYSNKDDIQRLLFMIYTAHFYYLNYAAQEAFFHQDFHVFTIMRYVFESWGNFANHLFSSTPKLTHDYELLLIGELLADRFELSIDLDHLVVVDLEADHPVIKEFSRRLPSVKILYNHANISATSLVFTYEDEEKEKLIAQGVKERKIATFNEIRMIHAETFSQKAA